MSECVFCDIVAGDELASIEREWDDALAIVPLNPVTDGHVLIIPKKHVADALIDPPTTAMVAERTAEFAGDHYYDCNLITSCGEIATQTVFHLHFHVVPRREADGLPLPWTS